MRDRHKESLVQMLASLDGGQVATLVAMRNEKVLQEIRIQAEKMAAEMV